MTDSDRFQGTFEARFEARLQSRADLATRPFDDLGIARDAMAVARRRRSWWPAPGRLALVRPAPRRGWVLLVVLLVALVAGALVVGSQLLAPSPPLPIPADHGLFTPTGSVSVARMSGTFTATRLRDGRVLVVGGTERLPQTEDGPGEQVLTTAEIWDPSTGLFSPTGSLTRARTGHTATLLHDGRVLVVGGGEDPSGESNGAAASAEIWDPSTGQFSPMGPIEEQHHLHTATLLEDGRVLVVGGSGSEVWDPHTGIFSPSGSLIVPREAHTATLLDDGRVLIIGGDQGEEALWSAELWDPTTGSFGPAGRLSDARTRHAVTLLPDGRVLVVGGVNNHYAVNILAVHVLGSAEVWDPGTLTFGPAGTLTYKRADATATVLADDHVLIAGGGIVSDDSHVMDHVATAEVWDPATSTFEAGPTLATARSGHTATLLEDGRILIVGGETIPVVRNCFDGRTVPLSSECGGGGLRGTGTPVPIDSVEIYVP